MKKTVVHHSAEMAERIPANHSMKSFTPDQMLDWTAVYVTEINSLQSEKGEHIELIAASGEDESIVVRRKAKTAKEGFRKCLRYAMKNFHPPK